MGNHPPRGSAPLRLRNRRFKGIDYKPIFPPGKTDFGIHTKFTTILASGPNGVAGWDFLEKYIPREQNTIIAVNYAVTFGWQFSRPYIVPDIWGVTDKKAIGQIVPPDKASWFPAALERYANEGGKICFNLKVIEEVWNQLHHPGPFYMFRSKRLMTQLADFKPHEDVIRPGGSVTCSMSQIWYHFCLYMPVKDRVLLICGADMSGDDYAKGKNTLKQHGKDWNSIACLGGMIKYYKSKGRQIYTVSKTKLVDHKYIDFYPGSEEYAKCTTTSV